MSAFDARQLVHWNFKCFTQLSELRKLRNSKFETRNPKQIRIFKCLNDQNTVDLEDFLAIKDYLDRFLKLEYLLDSILELIEKIEYFFNSESWDVLYLTQIIILFSNSTFWVEKMFNIFNQLHSRIVSVFRFQETIRIGLNRQKIV
jgi:hypothetical protein